MEPILSERLNQWTIVRELVDEINQRGLYKKRGHPPSIPARSTRLGASTRPRSRRTDPAFVWPEDTSDD